jgi:hypothetical protein
VSHRSLVLRVSALAALLTGFAVACQAIIGLERPTGEPGVERAEASTDAGAPPVDTCPHVRIPKEPQQDDDPATELPPFWLAVRRVAFAPKPDAGGRYYGFDLDHSCTCFDPDGGVTAFDGGEACRSKFAIVTVCDGIGGVDNAAAKMLEPYSSYDLDTLSGLDGLINDGRLGILLWVSKYNGRANDRSVTVGFVSSPGLFSTEGCSGPRDIDAGLDPDGGPLPHPPLWDGCDSWAAPQAEVIAGGGSVAPRRVADGYVVDGVLVVPGGQTTAPLAVGAGIIEMSAPHLVGTLAPRPDNRGYTLKGTIAGRAPVVSALRSLVNIKLSGVPLCQVPGAYTQFRDSICRNLDVPLQPRLDFTGVDCDGLTLASQVEAESVRVEESTAPPRPVPTDCDALLPQTQTLEQLCGR